MKGTTSRLCAMIVLSILAAGCGSNSSDGTSAAATIGPAGGTVQLGSEVTVSIPPGALASPQTITIARSSTATQGFSAFSRTYAFTPAGLSFQTPVTIRIAFQGSLDQARVFWSNPAGWEELDESVSAGLATASVTRLGHGFVGWQADVTGTMAVTNLSETGSTAAQLDLSTATVAATDGSGASYAGSGGVDGTFRITGAPSGTNLIQVGSDHFVTRKRILDLGSVFFGRTGAVHAGQPTRIDLTALNLAPWNQSDSFEMISPGAGLLLADLEQTVPAADAVSALFTYDLNGEPLPQAGDTLIVNQLESAVARDGTPYVALTRSSSQVQASAWAANTSFSMGLSPISQVSPAACATLAGLSLDASFFDEASASLFGPHAVASQRLLSIQGLPGGNDHGAYDTAPDLLIAAPSLGATSVDLGSLPYCDPFPAGWGTFGAVEKDYFVSYTAPGAATALQVFAGGVSASFALATAPQTLALPIGPVRNVTVDGKSAVTLAAGTSSPLAISAAPTLSFDPPASGTPARYEVRIQHLLPDAAHATTSTRAGRLGIEARSFSGTVSVKLPPGLISGGNTYFLEIEASSDGAAAPDRTTFPSSRSVVLTAALSAP